LSNLFFHITAQSGNHPRRTQFIEDPGQFRKLPVSREIVFWRVMVSRLPEWLPDQWKISHTASLENHHIDTWMA
jgi:hypothetical protein